MKKKGDLRMHFKEIRAKIPTYRRKMAAKRLFDLIMKDHLGKGLVLSFMSFRNEIEMEDLNFALAKAKELVLPKIVSRKLVLYKVEDIQKETKASELGFLEPNVKDDRIVDPKEIRLVLVPGLGFDYLRHRLGYGKGYYDRLLAHHKFPLSYGVGLKEQFSMLPLPKEKHDIRVDDLLLF